MSFEESQIMYTRAQGLQALETFRTTAGDVFSQPVVLRLKVLVQLTSHLAPAAEDLDELARCCTFVEAAPGPDSQSFYLVGLSRDDGSHIEESTRALRLVHLVFKYLVGLGIAAEALATWRRVGLAPYDLGLYRADGSPVVVNFTETPLEYVNARALHAGDLWGGIQNFVVMGRHEWHQRFIETYQRGCELMVAPLAPLANFHEEAYLCFFKCLEYIVMAKILDRSGQFNPKEFQAACERLGAQPSDPNGPMRAAVRLIATRGGSVAHLLKKQGDVSLEPQDLAHLKSMVDLLCRVFLRRFPRPVPTTT
jgi:hypothetical protein